MSKKQEQNDKQIREMFAKVQKEKAEISKAEKPNWKTNCSFGFERDSSNRRNIQTINSIDELVNILAFLIKEEGAHAEACKKLEVESTFTWMNFTVDEWAEDIKTRISKIEIVKKKERLEKYETILNKNLSQESRVALELEEIAKGLDMK